MRVQFHSTTPPASVPSAMLGDWSGTWISADGSEHGTAQIRLQAFQGQPLVRFAVDNPCLVPQQYRFVIAERHLELIGNGPVLFAADLDAGLRSLLGTYQCTVDRGTWTARWRQAVEPVGDLSGHWTGELRTTLNRGALPFELQLQQTWHDGQLRVAGQVQVGGGALTTTITSGLVDWDAGHFVLQLTVEQPATVLLEGVGDASQMVLDGGLLTMQVSGRPFGIGTFSMAQER